MTTTLWPTSPRTEELAMGVTAFMEEHVYPAEPVFERQLEAAADRWNELPVMTELKAKAKAAGLWNLFLPKRHFPDALTNLEYAPLCEIMGRSPIGPESFNCSAPDTGNMETLILYGTEEQPPPTLPISAPRSGTTATTTSSTAANGGPRAPWTVAARSRS